MLLNERNINTCLGKALYLDYRISCQSVFSPVELVHSGTISEDRDYHINFAITSFGPPTSGLGLIAMIRLMRHKAAYLYPVGNLDIVVFGLHCRNIAESS